MSQTNEPTQTTDRNLPETDRILREIECENRPMTMSESYAINMEAIRAIRYVPAISNRSAAVRK
ncbi:hypothetical protein [uncultured Rhodoblastus sp.]|uniref:hypothetical protein n=1 Tax=uncultured Rhodoblastus sp. TaxID=543037 RepID=UPI0025CD6BBF|nr:hypothetical protein [uncultured Rhodoblastus sp.]